MTVVFGLGTRLRVRMRTTFENGVLHNGQQPDRAVNSFIDQGELFGMPCIPTSFYIFNVFFFGFLVSILFDLSYS